MIKNYFKIAFRNIIRHKAYSFLNIAGLAIGMACSILILLWVQNEQSYDRFHTNVGQLYRLTCNAGDFKAAVSPAGMGPGLQAEMPEIKAVVRMSKPETKLLEVGNQKFKEPKIFYADSNFLQVFSFPLVTGDAKTALQRPDAILITEQAAKKYFGNENAIGKIIKQDNSTNLTVTGVLANIPSNSHLQFDFILPISAIAATNYDLRTNVWGNFNFYSYIQLDKNITPASAAMPKVLQRIQQIFATHEPGFKVDFHLQPITDIHLHSDLQIDLPGNGNIQYVNIFFIVAIFILGVACINFMNLATARSSRRAKEVGLRKVVGAGRTQLIAQFLGEPIIISFLSLLIAIGLVFLLLPAFNLLAQKQLSVHLFSGTLLPTLLAIALATGIISGSYPALYLSGFEPIKVLKGKLSLGGGNLIFRNTLVVTQFVIAIVLLVGTAVVYRQMNFIKSKHLGFEKSNLIYMPMNGELWDKREALNIALQQNGLTSNYSFISDLPVALVTGSVDANWEGKDPNSQTIIPSINIDEHFNDVFQTKMLAGRSFSKAFRGDSSNFVVNETMLRLMKMDITTAVGKSLEYGGVKGTIIGVMKDFNFKPLQYAIDPLVMPLERWGSYIMIRTPAGNTEGTIKALDKINHELNPAYPLTYSFLDSDLDNLYRGERQMESIFNLFAILAIFISCLGLYGLSAFMAEQRTKEIGVRKVLGASVMRIVYLLSGSFTKLIAIAVLIAIPLSWYAINSWLNGFAYRIDIGWMIFGIASLTALLIAWLTVSYESVKAALANPVKSLRSE